MRQSRKNQTKKGIALDGAEKDMDQLRSQLARFKDDSDKLNNLQNRFQAVKGAFFEGVMIVKNGEIVDANEAAAEIMGFDPGWMKEGQIPDLVTYGCPSEVIDCIENGTEEPHDFNLAYKDGDRRAISVRAKDIEYEGGPAKAVSVMDITRFRNTEQRLVEERTFAESIFQNLPDIFYVADLSGKLIKWNKALKELSGYSDEELATKNVMDFIADQDIPRVMTSLANTLTTGMGEVIETIVLAKDGTELDYEFFGCVFTDSEGNPIGISGIGRDVSVRNEA